MAGRFMAAVVREMEKRGTKGALRAQMGAGKGETISTSDLKSKAAALSKKAEGDKKLSADDLKTMRRVQMALRFRKQ